MITRFITAGLLWKVAGGDHVLAQGAANITFSNAIPIADVDQLGIGIAVLGTANPRLRMQWSADAATWFDEQVENKGTAAGGVQPYTLLTKEWGPLGAGNVVVHRPTDFLFVRFGVYTDNAPGGADSVQLTVIPQRTSQLQATGN